MSRSPERTAVAFGACWATGAGECRADQVGDGERARHQRHRGGRLAERREARSECPAGTRRRVGPGGHPLGLAATPTPGAPRRDSGRAGRGGGQLAVEVLDELRIGPGELGPAGPQLDRHSQDIGVVGGGAEMLGRPIGQDGLHKGLDAVLGHRSSSSATRAAIRKARYWRTLALLTPTSRARADSLMEHPSRNRSSRMRR